MKILRVIAAFTMFAGSWATFVYGLGWWSPVSWVAALITVATSLIEFIRARSQNLYPKSQEPPLFSCDLSEVSDDLGDPNCVYSARSSEIRCAVNPTAATCAGCRDFESIN